MSASSHAPRIAAFRAGLRDLGYVEGTNIVIEFRWAEGNYDRLPALAAELVRRNVDVIVTHAAPGALAAKQATTTIPIVITAIADMFAFGLIDSLSRPGGNVTGLSFFNAELGAKRLELLKEAVPLLTKAAVLLNPTNPAGSRLILQEVERQRGHRRWNCSPSRYARRAISSAPLRRWQISRSARLSSTKTRC